VIEREHGHSEVEREARVIVQHGSKLMIDQFLEDLDLDNHEPHRHRIHYNSILATVLENPIWSLSIAKSFDLTEEGAQRLMRLVAHGNLHSVESMRNYVKRQLQYKLECEDYDKIDSKVNAAAEKGIPRQEVIKQLSRARQEREKADTKRKSALNAILEILAVQFGNVFVALKFSKKSAADLKSAIEPLVGAIQQHLDTEADELMKAREIPDSPSGSK